MTDSSSWAQALSEAVFRKTASNHVASMTFLIEPASRTLASDGHIWVFLVTGHLGKDADGSVEEDCALLCDVVAASPSLGLESRPNMPRALRSVGSSIAWSTMNKRVLSFLSSTTPASTGQAGGGASKIIC
jgi:hypothetical protein